MKENELIEQLFEEIIKTKEKNLLKQIINGESVRTILLKKGTDRQLYELIKTFPDLINEQDPSGCSLVERLSNTGRSDILEMYAEYIDLRKREYNTEKNMLAYLIRRKIPNVIIKALEKNPDVINEKDPSGCIGVERLADAGYSDILEIYARHIDLRKMDYNSERNMLGYLIKKNMSNVIMKALEKNPSVINEKDPSGCTGVERLADAGSSNILEMYAEHIDLRRMDYNSERNMLGYLIKKNMPNVIMKALEKNPGVLNEKDPSGCIGVERLADAGNSYILEMYAEYIDLTKRDYNGERNMLGYLTKKYMSNVIIKALKKTPDVINKTDLMGCSGVERLADAGNSDILEIYAEHIDLTKRDYNGERNMLGYLIKKNMLNVVIKALEKTPDVINKRDSMGCSGVERLMSNGNISIVNQFAKSIDWSIKTRNDSSTLQYVLKRADAQREEIAMKLFMVMPKLINEEMKFIIDNNLVNILSYREIVEKINKNIHIDSINLLSYLIHKKQEKYVDIILNPDKAVYYFDQNIKQETSQRDKEILEDLPLIKESIHKIEDKEHVLEKSIKSRIKSML